LNSFNSQPQWRTIQATTTTGSYQSFLYLLFVISDSLE
jgi:hypothetical protein